MCNVFWATILLSIYLSIYIYIYKYHRKRKNNLNKEKEVGRERERKRDIQKDLFIDKHTGKKGHFSTNR